MWCGDEEALKKTAAARWKRAAGRVYAHMLSSCVSCLVSPVDDRHDDPRFRPRPIFARGYEPVSHFWYPRRWRRAQGASDELLHVRPSRPHGSLPVSLSTTPITPRDRPTTTQSFPTTGAGRLLHPPTPKRLAYVFPRTIVSYSCPLATSVSLSVSRVRCLRLVSGFTICLSLTCPLPSLSPSSLISFIFILRSKHSSFCIHDRRVLDRLTSA